MIMELEGRYVARTLAAEAVKDKVSTLFSALEG
jgi:hypothetical protein